MDKKPWNGTTIDQTATHHLWQNKPIYEKRFKQVLKFHSPGFAPVIDETGAYHIDIHGQPIYQNRYIQTFGYYEGYAAVETNNGWYHIGIDGKPCYSKRHAWCGNFQEGLCAVRDFKNQYFHINVKGMDCYPERYSYVGDFKEGYAVIHTHTGKCTHINKTGHYLHKNWFSDLDVYHKGYARAKDDEGWFHINKNGLPAYKERFATIEPFYNGIARVVTFANASLIIDNKGKIINTIQTGIDPSQQVSANMVGFWKTEIIAAAVHLRIFDALPGTLATLAKKLVLPKPHLHRLMRALWELKLVLFDKNQWILTSEGQLLVKDSYLASAAIMWSDINNQAWKKLPELIHASYNQHHDSFKQLCTHQQKKTHYLQALEGYAKKDFNKFLPHIDSSLHKSVLGIGYSSKVILDSLYDQFSHLALSFNPLHENLPEMELGKFLYQTFDIQKNWPLKIDIILFTKVLHYWPEHDVINILQRANQALNLYGKIYLMEILLSDKHPNGALLDLNMLIETGGMLRTLSQWEFIAAAAGLHIENVKPIAGLIAKFTLIKQ